MKKWWRGFFLLFLCLSLFSSISRANEETFLEAQLMILEEETNILTCEGDVFFSSPIFKVHGSYATFELDDLTFVFSGDITMEYQDLILTAEELEGDLEREDVLARGEVVINYEEYILKGDVFSWKSREERASMEGNVELETEEFILSGNRLEMDLDFTRLTMIGAAKWMTPEASGEAEEISYEEDKGILSLRGDVFVEMDEQIFYGEEIIYHRQEGRIRIVKGGVKLPSLDRIESTL